MSFADTISRVSELESMLAPQQAATLAGAPASAQPEPVSTSTFAAELQQAIGSTGGTSSPDGSAAADVAGQLALLSGLGAGTSPLAGQLYASAAAAPTTQLQPGTTVGARVAAIAEGEQAKNVVELTANEAPEIDLYHTAVAGAQPGDAWCAEFASWCAAQAGAPLGANGEGFRSVAALTDWAAQSGRLLPASATPQPGDLMLFGSEHVGVVDHVDPDGTIHTIEGNYANAVSAVARHPGEATGFVRLG